MWFDDTCTNAKCNQGSLYVIMESLRKDSEAENQEERFEEEEELGDVEVDEYDTSIAMKAVTMKSKKRSKRSVRIVLEL